VTQCRLERRDRSSAFFGWFLPGAYPGDGL